MPIKILVTGQPKTGTTILFYTIKAAMPHNTITYFDTRTLPDALFKNRQPALAKILLKEPTWMDYSRVNRFAKQIIIIRDPRDTLISMLLYQLKHTSLVYQPEQQTQLLDAIREKEQSPTGHPLMQLIKQRDAATDVDFIQLFMRHLGFACDFYNTHPHAHVIKYEDLAAGNLNSLANYLKLPLRPITNTQQHRHVARTKTSGDWQNWITADDIPQLRALLDPYLEHYGYPIDWTLSKQPHIKPEHGSQFVEQLIKKEQQRGQQKVKRAVKPSSQSFLVTGQPKSGTTALAQLIRQALPEKTVYLAEPRRFEPSTVRNAPYILAKTLLFPHWVDHHSFAGFHKKVLIIRDPRDTIISRLLWWVTLPAFSERPTNVEQFNLLLKAKEEAPKQISMTDLINQWNTLSGKKFLKEYTRALDFSLQFHEQHPEFFMVRYEDLIDRKMQPLTEYLKLPLAKEAPHVSLARTKAYGNWRHWLTAADIPIFRELFADYLQQYGYSDEWELAPNPVIKNEHASGFITRILQEQANARHAKAVARKT